MENQLKEVYNCILEFEKYVVLTDQLFRKKYGILISPFRAVREKIASRKGLLHHEDKEISFQFHGKGCRFNFSGLIVDYDYGDPPDFEYEEGFDLWKLYQFVLSHKNFEVIKDKVVFHDAIKEMESRGIIRRQNPLYDTFFIKV